MHVSLNDCITIFFFLFPVDSRRSHGVFICAYYMEIHRPMSMDYKYVLNKDIYDVSTRHGD